MAMRLLYALDTYRPNIDGVAVASERLAHGLSKRGHTVAVVAPARRLADYLETVSGLPVYRVRSLRLLSDRWWVPLLPREGVQRAIRDFRPDVVVVSLPFLLSRAALVESREQGVPVVGVTGTMPEWLTANLPLPHELAKKAWPALWRAIAAYYNGCDVVVGVTHTALDLLRIHGLSRPGAVISNGVSPRRFRPRRRDVAMACSLGLDQRPTVLYTGRLDAEKDMDIWLRAAARLRELGVDAQYLLVGNGTERNKLAEYARSLGLDGQMRFAGFMESGQYERVFSLGDVFAIASRAELQSIVALEAAASGLPLVAAEAGALPELVRHGFNGYLFPPRDQEAMAQRLANLLADRNLLRQMGRRSRLIALQHDIEQSVGAYERLFESLLGRKHQRSGVVWRRHGSENVRAEASS